MSDLITVEEVAEYLRVTKKTIYRLIERNQIPVIKLGRQWRFDRNVIDDWLKMKTVGRRTRILVIDDEETIQILFKDTLSELGHETMTAGTGTEGLELVKQQDFDLAFIDLKIPGMDGVELFRQIKNIKPDMTVIIITGYPDSNLMSQALAQGPFGVMKKPFGERDIINATNNFLRLSV